ncbi:MAG: hypothetical protein AB8I08_02980 [Sandaracinaceae bacterium]
MTRPHIRAGLVADTVAGVPSRLQRKLDKNPTLADGWAWRANGEWVEVQASEEVTVTVRAEGVHTDDDLRCGCLLAPRCLHRLAVARALPLATDGPVESDEPETPSSTPLEQTEVSEKERAAARASLTALQALLGTGLEGAGIVVEGAVLGAVHQCRDAGLHRLSASLLRMVGHIRGRGAENDLLPVMRDLRDALGLADTLSNAERASLEERGWGRRPYHPLDPVALFGIVTVPFSTTVGYSGVTTFVVDRAGELSSFSHVVPENSAGLSEKTSLLKGASLTHGQASRHQVLLEGGTRSLDGRLGTGSKVKTVLGAPVDWWTAPVSALFSTPLDAQLERVFTSRTRPPHLRSEGAGLLFIEGTSDGHGHLVVEGTALPLRARAHATERERADLANLGRATGRTVRMVARAGETPTLIPLAFGIRGQPVWVLGRGGNRDIESAWGAQTNVPDAAVPPPLDTRAWRPLERVLIGVVRLGWRAVAASRSARVEEDAARLRRAGFKGADELVRHMVRRGAHAAPRRGPELEALAAAWRATSLYLAHLDAWAARHAWRRGT